MRSGDAVTLALAVPIPLSNLAMPPNQRASWVLVRPSPPSATPRSASPVTFHRLASTGTTADYIAVPQSVPSQETPKRAPVRLKQPPQAACATTPAALPVAAAERRKRRQTAATRPVFPQPHRRSTASLRQTAAGTTADEDTTTSDRESETLDGPFMLSLVWFPANILWLPAQHLPA